MDLQKYKEELSKLSENEKKQRDLYLKKFAEGKIYGPTLGYPSIDKPWLKYYSEEAIMSEVPNISAYEFMKLQNGNNLNGKALSFFGNDITYRELLKKIDEVAKSLMMYGIKKDDVVTVCLPNLPEAVYLFYAINKIGAVANFIHVLSTSKEIEFYVNSTNSKLIVSMDKFIKKFDNEEILKDKNIVCVTAMDSLVGIKKGLYRAFNKPESISSQISWSKFLNDGKQLEHNVETVRNERAAILYTGGTTDSPKGVTLSNNNLNNLANHYINSGMELNNKQTFLDIIPPFVPYGLCGSIHMPLCVGVKIYLIPEYNPKEFDKLVIKHKPNHILGVPAHYEYLMASKKVKNKDLSFIISAGAGGDSFSKKNETKINEFLKEHGCTHKVAKGYGMTELSSSACTCLDNANVLQSVGVPLFKNNMFIRSIEDENSMEELPYNEVGEICFSSPSMMMGYNNNEELTEEATFNIGNERWIHTGDLGKINEDGMLFIVGRLKRMIIKSNGYKIYAKDIETVIDSHSEVVTSSVVGIPDTVAGAGMVPVAAVVLNDYSQQERIKEEIFNICSEKISERCKLEGIYFMEEIPKTSLGKIDYKKITKTILELREEEIKRTLKK